MARNAQSSALSTALMEERFVFFTINIMINAKHWCSSYKKLLAAEIRYIMSNASRWPAIRAFSKNALRSAWFNRRNVVMVHFFRMSNAYRVIDSISTSRLIFISFSTASSCPKTFSSVNIGSNCRRWTINFVFLEFNATYNTSIWYRVSWLRDAISLINTSTEVLYGIPVDSKALTTSCINDSAFSLSTQTWLMSRNCVRTFFRP